MAFSGESGTSPSTPAPAPSAPSSAAPAAPSPQSTPGAGASPSVPGSEADAAGVDWGVYAGFEDTDQGPKGGSAPEPDSAALAAAATATPPSLEPPPTPQPPEPQKAVEPAPSKDGQPPKSPAEQAFEQINSPEWQQERLTQLEQGYQLSEEEAQAFEENPTKALPSLMAKAHLKLAFQMTQMVDQMMQQMLVPVIQHQIGQADVRREAQAMANEQIFKPFPRLREVPADMMGSIVNMVKATSPATLSGADKLARVAKIAYEANGWEFPAAGASPAPAPAAARGLPPISPPATGSLPAAPAASKASSVDEQGTDWGSFANV